MMIQSIAQQIKEDILRETSDNKSSADITLKQLQQKINDLDTTYGDYCAKDVYQLRAKDYITSQLVALDRTSVDYKDLSAIKNQLETTSATDADKLQEIRDKLRQLKNRTTNSSLQESINKTLQSLDKAISASLIIGDNLVCSKTSVASDTIKRLTDDSIDSSAIKVKLLTLDELNGQPSANTDSSYPNKQSAANEFRKFMQSVKSARDSLNYKVEQLKSQLADRLDKARTRYLEPTTDKAIAEREKVSATFSKVNEKITQSVSTVQADITDKLQKVKQLTDKTKEPVQKVQSVINRTLGKTSQAILDYCKQLNSSAAGSSKLDKLLAAVKRFMQSVGQAVNAVASVVSGIAKGIASVAKTTKDAIANLLSNIHSMLQNLLNYSLQVNIGFPSTVSQIQSPAINEVHSASYNLNQDLQKALQKVTGAFNNLKQLASDITDFNLNNFLNGLKPKFGIDFDFNLSGLYNLMKLCAQQALNKVVNAIPGARTVSKVSHTISKVAKMTGFKGAERLGDMLDTDKHIGHLQKTIGSVVNSLQSKSSHLLKVNQSLKLV